MSLRWRFTLLVTGLLAVVLVALGVWIAGNEKELAREEVQRRLQRVVERVVPETLPAPTERPRRPRPAEREEGPRPLGHIFKGVTPIKSVLPADDADIPGVVEWFAGPNRVAVLTGAGERIETPPFAGRIDGPAARPQGPPLQSLKIAGRWYFVHSWPLGQPYVEQEDGTLKRTNAVEGGRGKRPPGARRPGRGPRGRGPGGRRPRPPQNGEDEDGPRPRQPGPGDGPPPMRLQLVGRVIADSDAMLDVVGYSDRIRTLWFTGIAAILLGGLFSWFVSGAMVRPIGRAARAAEDIRQLRQRLPEPGSKDELGRLVIVLNEMLGRLHEGATRERRFLATASHELRRPLAALTAELELAARAKRSSEELAAAIGLALGDARNMGRLVDDLLAHARARAGALTLGDGEVDLVDLVGESVNRCARIVGEGANLQVGAVPEAVLRGDADALGRVIENLVLNAATHGGDGVTVQVSADQTNAGLRVHVEDNGPGIPPEELDRVFEAFGRGDTASHTPGAGLGLAIVQDLVAAHGGTVHVTSPLAAYGAGRGTRFTVRLPGNRVISEG